MALNWLLGLFLFIQQLINTLKFFDIMRKEKSNNFMERNICLKVQEI